MVKLVKVQSEMLAKKKATPTRAAESGNAAKKKEVDDNKDKLEDKTSPPPQVVRASLPEDKEAPPEETSPVEAEESEEEDEDDNEAVNAAFTQELLVTYVLEEESEPPSKITPEMATPTEELDEDNDEEAGEEEMDMAPAPVAKAKKGGMVKPKEDLENEDDDDDDGDDDDDDGDEEEEVQSAEDEPALTPRKRKVKTNSKKEAPPVKKAKSDNKGFCLFIGNLDKSKSFMEIKEALVNFFKENDLEIQNVRLGSSKKFGYGNFATEEQLQKALALNGKTVMDQKLRLDKAKVKETPPAAKKGQTKTLYIKGLSKETTDNTLRKTFEGAIAARVASNKQTGSSKGFGFVDFDSEESCKMAKESMEYCEIDGNKVTLDFARSKSERGQHGAGDGKGGRGGSDQAGGLRGGRGGRGANRGRFKGRGGGLKGKPQEKKEV
ncbi:nucleolin-like isoform X3 [Anguilla anguilla]|uniref:nucleolin-like isoform X3 n=1 Tax=Anguilla anguilla TaxID=7936 RepID=UPI0015B2FDCC|nr:nucleolin-like isoform X3 [Anguilla anguilla]